MEREKHTFQVRVEPLRNAEKAITGAIGVVLDVTDRKHTMAQLQERARQQAAVAELGQEVLFCKDVSEVMNTAVRLVREILKVGLLLRPLPAEESRMGGSAAGVGWNAKYAVGTVLDDSVDSLAIHTLSSRRSVILDVLADDPRFRGSQLLAHMKSSAAFPFFCE